MERPFAILYLFSHMETDINAPKQIDEIETYASLSTDIL